MLDRERGLMAEAHIYLVDEPSLGLAPGIAETIVRTLCGLDLGGGALVLAEQNRTLLEGRIDRIVRIHAGAVASIEPGTAAAGAGMTAVLITTVYLAAVYSLVALGLSLTWAGLGFLNLAHGRDVLGRLRRRLRGRGRTSAAMPSSCSRAASSAARWSAS